MFTNSPNSKQVLLWSERRGESRNGREKGERQKELASSQVRRRRKPTQFFSNKPVLEISKYFLPFHDSG